jgi:hypothetical protein
MARDHRHPVADSGSAPSLTDAAPTIEVMVLDVPRAAVREIERELATLATLPSIELVDAAPIPRDLGTRSVSGPGGPEDDLDEREDAFAGAFFGAEEERESSVRSEILEAIGRLPASRAAVVVMYRNRWRSRLDGLFRSNGVQVLVERTVSPADAMRLTSERPAALEQAVGAEA